MEMKRLGTILSGLCLLFALSVSSVAVAGPCDTCAKCDQDGDTYFDTTSMCIRKCDSDLNRQDPDDADPDDPAIPVVGCPVGGGTVTKYTVTLKEDVKGVSVFEGWSTSKSGNKWINLNDAHTQPGMKVDLTFFADLDASNKCFPGAATTQLFAATISQKNIKGGIKQAIASWWFEARTTDDKAYNYVLQMFGEFPPDTVWPGDVTLDMVNWEMNDASGNGETTQTACLGEDVFVTTIIVN